MPCVSVWYKNSVFYQHIFVTLSFIPAEPGRVGWETKQGHTHTDTHIVLWMGSGRGSLFSLPTPDSSSGLELAILGFLGTLWFELATLLIAIGTVLAGGYSFLKSSEGNVFVWPTPLSLANVGCLPGPHFLALSFGTEVGREGGVKSLFAS